MMLKDSVVPMFHTPSGSNGHGTVSWKFMEVVTVTVTSGYFSLAPGAVVLRTQVAVTTGLVHVATFPPDPGSKPGRRCVSAQTTARARAVACAGVVTVVSKAAASAALRVAV